MKLLIVGKCSNNVVRRYKKEYLMFNDDIQGTAATVLAGLYGAMKVQGLAPEDLKNQVWIIKINYRVFWKYVIPENIDCWSWVCWKWSGPHHKKCHT